MYINTACPFLSYKFTQFYLSCLIVPGFHCADYTDSLTLLRVFLLFLSSACATVHLEVPEQREPGNRRVALSSFFPLPCQIGLVFSLLSSIFPYGCHLGRVVRNETLLILVLHPKIHIANIWIFHLLNHKPSFCIYISIPTNDNNAKIR